MCEIIKKLRRKSISGYKIVAHKDGSFYSTFTGQKYELNKPIKGIDEKTFRMSSYWTPYIDTNLELIKECSFYQQSFINKTSVSLSYNEIFELGEEINMHLFAEYKDYDIVLVKMTLGGDIYSAKFHSAIHMYAGTQIKAIKIVHTFQKQ